VLYITKAMTMDDKETYNTIFVPLSNRINPKNNPIAIPASHARINVL